MTPDTRYVSTKCFSSDKEEKNQGGTAESFVPTKGGWFLFYVLKDVYEKGEMKMKDKLQQIREKAIAEIEGSDGLERLNEVRQAVLGKKGELTAVLKGMKDVAPEDRPKVGQWVNDTRSAIETVLEEKMKILEADALKKRYEAEKIDVTMPAVKHEKGNLHPVTQVRNQLIDIFASMGFEVYEGAEIETDYYNTTGSPGKRYAGYLLSFTGIPASYTDIRRTDPRYGSKETTDQGHFSW